MRWFRRNIRPVACLALFALGLQLALSFNHIHGDELLISSANAEDTIVVNIKLVSSGSPTLPTGHDFCSICATISLAGSLVLPAPPVHAMPRTIDHAWAPGSPSSFVTTARQFSFQARAPPHHCRGSLENWRAAA
jgi:hypothetical protein